MDNGLPKQIRVAVLSHRFGPYHHARLNAAGKLMSVFGMEACAMEDTYAWAEVKGAGAFTRITLTDRDTGDRRWRRELQRKLSQALEEIKPQVVAINGWSSTDALSALWWCAETNTPAIVMSESTSWDEPRVFWKEWIKGRLVKLNAAGLAGGAPHVDYLAQLGLAREHLFPGYDVVDNAYFSSRAALARDHKLETSKPPNLPEKYFLASARFIEKKNLSRLLEAYARYRELAREPGTIDPNTSSELKPAPSSQRSASTPWNLVLLGDGPLRETLNSQLSTLNLRDHVLLPGFKQYNELPGYFGPAGVFIHPSVTEQWGLVVNEAMASGLPVLVSNRCGCARDLVQTGVNGFTFNPRDIEEMAQRMWQLSTLDPQLLSTMGVASRHIISNWGPERFAEGLQKAVAVALGHSPGLKGPFDRLLLRLALTSVVSGILKTS